MKDYKCPSDAVCAEEQTCMQCGDFCNTAEIVWTGDMDSYEGFELWCWCEKCQVETFHRLIKKEDED